MDEDSFWVLLALVAIAALLLGPIGFFLTLGARSRLSRLERELAAYKALGPVAPTVTRTAAAPEVVSQTPAPTPEAEPAPLVVEHPPSLATPEPVSAAAPEEVRIEPEAVAAAVAPEAEKLAEPAAPAARAAPPAPKRTLEELLGARWAVIVGGIALALGALLLVKYSIDQGYFGPATRVVAGLALGLALIAGGETMRHKNSSAVSPKGAAPIPAVLTAAGTVAAFGSIYAADALYGFIGPTLAFVLLGVLAIAAMFAAVLHGPALAGLGLVGALAVPMLVDSHDPSPWPVVPYVAIVCAAAYGLARMRKWLWLACAAGAGAALWQVLLLIAIGSDSAALFVGPSLVNAIIEIALALVVFAVGPHYPTPEAEQQRDPVGWIAVAAASLLACLVLLVTAHLANASALWIFTTTALTVMLALVGFRLPAVALAAAGAALVLLTALATWGTGPAIFADLGATITRGDPPVGEQFFLLFGVGAPLALGGLFIFRLIDRANLSLLNSAIYAGAGVLTPLAALSILYLRLAHFETSQTFAGLAVALAVVMSGAATQFQKLRAEDSFADNFAGSRRARLGRVRRSVAGVGVRALRGHADRRASARRFGRGVRLRSLARARLALVRAGARRRCRWAYGLRSAHGRRRARQDRHLQLAAVRLRRAGAGLRLRRAAAAPPRGRCASAGDAGADDPVQRVAVLL